MLDAYSYQHDASVPKFDDSKPLFVFDGVCVLCSGGASWLMRHDHKQLVNFCSGQSTLGQALYRHYGIDFDQTYLLVDHGQVYSKSQGYLRLCSVLGGIWHLVRVAALIPRPIRDWAYDMVARTRYRWFGRAQYCALLTAEQRQRMLDQ